MAAALCSSSSVASGTSSSSVVVESRQGVAVVSAVTDVAVVSGVSGSSTVVSAALVLIGSRCSRSSSSGQARVCFLLVRIEACYVSE